MMRYGYPRLLLFDLNPDRALAAVGQRRDQLPLAHRHARRFGVEVEVPLGPGQTELVAGRFDFCGCCIKR
jgi:hypothetical protein